MNYAAVGARSRWRRNDQAPRSRKVGPQRAKRTNLGGIEKVGFKTGYLAAALACAFSALFLSAGPAAAEMTDEAARAAIEAGQSAMQRQDWTSAFGQFERASANEDLAPVARFYTGLTREQMGDQAAAVEDYKAVLEMNSYALGDLRSVTYDRLTEIGLDQLEKSDPVAAIVALEAAAISGSFDTLYYWGAAAVRVQDWTSLQRAGERLLQLQRHSGEGWQFTLHALEQMARAGGADASDLQDRILRTRDQIMAQPILLNELSVGEEDGAHVVTATMVGNAAPAGSWCIIDFSLNMAQRNWRAGVMVTAPASGQAVQIKARPATNDNSSAPPPVSERIYNVRYKEVYCELPDAAAATPPEAKKVKLDGCPDTEREARQLLANRPEIGRLSDGRDAEYAYPAGGLTLFGSPVSRLTVKDDLYRFGLSGAFAGHEKKFAQRYRTDCAEDGISDYCQKSHERKNGYISFATLADSDWPEGMRPRQTYLSCLYK
ncbi:hypothetical protein HNE_1179 [Hyphomonas neptunium ATCC 15444]|uniref:Tetratricopeptide repeat protein n=1 Tax=Hyphomonas neptunium (strain ATCC 15444) TaxID=228405 RepID=Q0C2Z6_HYPNA|nr:hypothetical protein HNE_1179 [Hyphomonas neptunium ATCC 15444]